MDANAWRRRVKPGFGRGRCVMSKRKLKTIGRSSRSLANPRLGASVAPGANTLICPDLRMFLARRPLINGQQGQGRTLEKMSEGNLKAAEAADMEWAFNEGQCVTHRDQSLPSLVMSRFMTKIGAFYGVRSFAFEDAQRDRIILGDCLRDVVPGSASCDGCLLYNTGMCPGDKR